jgi:F0F1-type ATP synthase gamma subunit
MYVEFTAGERTYKLRLTTRGIVQLEKSLGYNPLQMFMGIDEDVLPKFSDMIKVFHQMLQAYEHGISENDVYDIYDAFVADGHSMWDLMPILIEVFQEAGFLPKEDIGDSKN